MAASWRRMCSLWVAHSTFRSVAHHLRQLQNAQHAIKHYNLHVLPSMPANLSISRPVCMQAHAAGATPHSCTTRPSHLAQTAALCACLQTCWNILDPRGLIIAQHEFKKKVGEAGVSSRGRWCSCTAFRHLLLL